MLYLYLFPQGDVKGVDTCFQLLVIGSIKDYTAVEFTAAVTYCCFFFQKANQLPPKI